MKKTILLFCGCAFSMASAQDHFSGINTSQRVGVLNANINPAELADLRSKYETQLFAISANVANNKVGFSDLNSDADFEDLIFNGNKPVNFRADTEIHGPAFAFRVNKWAFMVGLKAYAKMDMVDVDPNLGDAVSSGNSQSQMLTTIINNDFNQRITGTSWGELGLSVARNLYETDVHKINGGLTIKLLFPGSYANFGANQFSGTILTGAGSSILTDANADLNVSYSGNLGETFDDFSDYTSSIFGGLNGVAFDFGANYQWKDVDNVHYKIKAGFALRNMGSMTFSDANNASTNYVLNIAPTEQLNLEVFEDADGLADAEDILLDSGYLNKNEKDNIDFKVKTPAVFSAYADFKVVPKLYVTLYTKQKLNDSSANDQIATQNVFSVTPRFTINNFELWSTWSDNEISGLAGGLGLRFYGFFIGSGSAITALANDSKQADVFLGYSFGLR